MLQISHISKTFNPGTVNEKKALNGVDLHLGSGDFVTILGSNGAGKSTLFGAIAGSFVVDEGTIRLDGQNITSLPDYKRSKFIGRLFQDPLKGTAPSMTIEENLALAYLRASEKRSPFSVVTAKDRAGFREKLAQLELAGAESGEAPILMLDDVMSELDPSRRRQLIERIDRVQTFVTCTDLSDLAGARQGAVYRVENGVLTRT